MSDPDIDPVELINSRRAGFSKFLGIVVTEATPDCVKATLEVREELCTRPEVLHGGAIMALLVTSVRLRVFSTCRKVREQRHSKVKRIFCRRFRTERRLMPKRRRCTKVEARWSGARISNVPTVSCAP